MSNMNHSHGSRATCEIADGMIGLAMERKERDRRMRT